MPNVNRNAYDEYNSTYSKCNFFDLDKNSEINSELPHMPTKKQEKTYQI